MTLADFKYISPSKEGRVWTEWPVLFLESASTAIVQDEDSIRLDQLHELVFEIQIVGPDPDNLTRDIFRYVRAVDAIFRSMTSAEIAAGLSVTNNYGARVQEIEHAYDVLRGDGTVYMKRAQLKVLVAITEVD